MDRSKQLYEIDATGWKRGLYDDVKRTFRAPIVNWIFRTTMANYPEFLRYAQGQVKPIFETARFGRFSVTYRDTVLSVLEDEMILPTYRRDNLGIAPAEYGELHGQPSSSSASGRPARIDTARLPQASSASSPLSCSRRTRSAGSLPAAKD